jgi:tetratricopeptide (TPR) repeat protein
MIGNLAIADLGASRFRIIIHGLELAIILALTYQTWREFRMWRVDQQEPRHIRGVQERTVYRASMPWAARGVKRVKDGITEGAIEDYRKALSIYPDFPEVHNNLGLLLAIRGNLDEAAEHYRAALRAKPDYPLAYTNLGDVLLFQGKVDEAVASYRRALELDPDLASAHRRLYEALHSTYKRDARQIIADQVRSMSKESAPLAKQADERARKADLQGAIEDYRAALKIFPMYPEVHNNIGLLLASRGDYPEAIEHYREALRLNPEFPLAYTNLGDALLLEGNYNEAIDCFRLALKLDPKLTSAHRSLEKALAATKLHFDIDVGR